MRCAMRDIYAVFPLLHERFFKRLCRSACGVACTAPQTHEIRFVIRAEVGARAAALTKDCDTCSTSGSGA